LYYLAADWKVDWKVRSSVQEPSWIKRLFLD